MSDTYNLNITEEVIRHFNNVLLNSEEINEKDVVGSAKKTLSEVQGQELEKYVTDHIATLEKMMKMLTDKRWKTSKKDKKFILSALQYFTKEDDLIPDDIPKIGLLDDCIMIDIVEQQIKQKLLSYKEYIAAAKTYGDNQNYSTKDWKKTKRNELFSRIRHRRLRSRSRTSSRGTSFSIM